MKLLFAPLILSAAAIPASVAFVPVATPTTTTGSRSLSVVGRSSFVCNSPFPASSSLSTSGTSTALQMNLLDRFFRVAKSNVNLVLSSLEDPEKIMSQAVEDMQKDLLKVRQVYSQVTASQRRLQERYNQHEATAKDWYRRAQLALERGMDDLARQALTRRQVALDEAAAVQKELNVNGAALDKLYESMQMLDRKILEAKSKKDQMAARAQTAKTTIEINDMLSGVTGKTSMDAFNRMEQKVEALEAAAEASASMGSLPALSGEKNLEDQFLALEASDAVDGELMRLKQSMRGTEMKYLSSSSSSSGMSDEELRVEDELRAMKESVKSSFRRSD